MQRNFRQKSTTKLQRSSQQNLKTDLQRNSKSNCNESPGRNCKPICNEIPKTELEDRIAVDLSAQRGVYVLQRSMTSLKTPFHTKRRKQTLSLLSSWLKAAHPTQPKETAVKFPEKSQPRGSMHLGHPWLMTLTTLRRIHLRA